MEEFLKINGVPITAPASCSYELSEIVSSDSGRTTRTGKTRKDCIAQKRTLKCRWNAMPVKEASLLATAMKDRGVIVEVTFFDVMQCKYLTRQFTTGNFTCDYLQGFTKTRKFVGSISCDFTEV